MTEGLSPEYEPLPPEEAVPDQQPVWLHPPEGVVPGVVPLEVAIGRSATTAVGTG